MASGKVSGIAVALTVGGFLLFWSGLKGQTLKVTATDLLKGQSPPAAAEAPPSIGLGSPDASGQAGADAGGQVGNPPGGKTISPAAAYTALRNAGLAASVALILTAVGGAESGWNVNSLNDNPATGDYSVGVWQINYYDGLMAERSAEFGSPSQLLGNLQAQANAAAAIYHQQGLSAWTTYTSGKYTAFLLQAQQAASGPGA